MARSATASRSPIDSSTATAWGSRLMPTPSGRISREVSNTSTSTPMRCSFSASTSPAMPAPAINTFMRRLLP